MLKLFQTSLWSVESGLSQTGILAAVLCRGSSSSLILKWGRTSQGMTSVELSCHSLPPTLNSLAVSWRVQLCSASCSQASEVGPACKSNLFWSCSVLQGIIFPQFCDMAPILWPMASHHADLWLLFQEGSRESTFSKASPPPDTCCVATEGNKKNTWKRRMKEDTC